MHCVDLGERFQTHIFLQNCSHLKKRKNLASIQPRTSPVKFARPSGVREVLRGAARAADGPGSFARDRAVSGGDLDPARRAAVGLLGPRAPRNQSGTYDPAGGRGGV